MPRRSNTRAPNGEGGKPLKRKDGRWRARVTYRDREGRARTRDVYGDTSQECSTNKRAFLASVRQRMPDTDPDSDEHETLEHFFERWLDTVIRPNRKPTTYENYRTQVRNHIGPELGHHELRALSPQHVQSFVNGLRRVGGLSARSTRDVHAILRSALNQALRWGLVTRNVASLVELPRSDTKPARFLSPEEARSLLRAVSGHRLEALFVCGLALGLRRGELLGMRWEDVDLERGLLTVRHTRVKAGNDILEGDPKTRTGYRLVHLPEVVAGALWAHRARQHLEARSRPEGWQESGYVFTTRVGTPLHPDNLRRELLRVAKAAGVDIHVHGLRHTNVSLLIAQKIDVKVISEIIGHREISTTLDIYGHVFDAQRREAANAMDSILGRNDIERPPKREKGAG